jgi:hypothetical protein
VEGGVTVVQDVPVRVLSAADLSRYSEPAVPNPLVRAVWWAAAQGKRSHNYHILTTT